MLILSIAKKPKKPAKKTGYFIKPHFLPNPEKMTFERTTMKKEKHCWSNAPIIEVDSKLKKWGKRQINLKLN